MRIHVIHKGEDYWGVNFSSIGKKYLQYAEISKHDYKIISSLMNIQMDILNKYPENDALDSKINKILK